MVCCSAVGAEHGGVEAGCSLDLSLRTSAGVVVGDVLASTDGTVWGGFASSRVVAILTTFGTLGGVVKPDVGGDPAVSPKEKETHDGIVGIVAPHNTAEHVEGFLAFPLLWLGEPAGRAVKGGDSVILLYLLEHLGEPLCSGGDINENVAEGHLTTRATFWRLVAVGISVRMVD